MDTRDAYNNWSASYDTVMNKTRDLEAQAIRSVLQDEDIETILEIGCGTGKNTGWLSQKCNQLIAADFSREMLDIAREKYKETHIVFTEANISLPWTFPHVDLVTCSLVLEHIRDLSFIFEEAAKTLNAGGKFYICELHPYRQLTGSRAKFEKDGALFQLEYFVHHISEFFTAAKAAGLSLLQMNEWFDTDGENPLPRLVSFVFQKSISNG
jgi:ubiquinone/menaquinone biosynthesis C-methylase UbiE